MPDTERETQTEKDLHFQDFMFQMKENLHYLNEREEKSERKDREREDKTRSFVAIWSLDVTQAVTLIKIYDISIHVCSSEIYMPKFNTYKRPLMYNLHLKH